MDEQSARRILGKLGITILGRSAQGWLRMRCPFAPWTHKGGTDKHPAFAVHVDATNTSKFTCLACGKKGHRLSDLVRGLSFYRGIEYPGLTIEADRADMEGVLSNPWEAEAVHDAQEIPVVDESLVAGAYPTAWETPEAQAYLARRGIGARTAERLGLLYDPDERRIMFPVRGRNMELYGFTGRSILKEEQFPRRNYPKVRDYLGLPKRALLLGLHLHRYGRPVLVVEGLFGLAHFHEIGLGADFNIVALMGNEMTPQKARELSMLHEKIYLFLDNDQGGDVGLFGPLDSETGQHSGHGAVEKLEAIGEQFFVPAWPEGKEDPDQLTAEEVRNMIETCAPWGFTALAPGGQF